MPFHDRRTAASPVARLRPVAAWAFALLVIATILGLAALMVAALAGNGFDPWDWVLTLCFALTLPWTVIGFWNAVIGLLLMRRPGPASPPIWRAPLETPP